ncbi:hypothetical protein DID88_004451 [Monilinia fructigena]|uniref:Uncharacterized protein n=1 Tax=Monilinia fructigena TaxID=38457 RepID=A0A395IRX7_9HELO|nr:hypothetical protein DID88_004451 [Monilinia fructigena]
MLLQPALPRWKPVKALCFSTKPFHLKDQIVELRNTMSTINMYVRWLLNVRTREGQRRSFGNGSSSGGGVVVAVAEALMIDNNGGSGPSSGGSGMGRRLCDHIREGGTKL